MNSRTAEHGDGASARFEERMRRALSDAAATVEPAPWAAGEVLGRAARRRRNRRVAVCVPLVVAVAAIAALAAGVARGPDEPRPVAAAPAPPPRPRTPPSPAVVWPAVRVAEPGRAIGFGGGVRMRLAAGERCVDWKDGGGWDCRDESNEDGNQPQGSVSTQAYGYTGGMRYTLLYRGTAAPARMCVTVAGRAWPATVVTLPGHPGWAAGYLDLPTSAASQGPFTPLGLTVWDADGRVIASLEEPRG
nr:hypothetical protein OH826_31075 [Streptomyces sp. NBC_00899]